MRAAAITAAGAALMAFVACGGSGATREGPARATGAVRTDVVSAPAGSGAGSYWTAARMRNAKPVGLLQRAGKPRLSRRIPRPGGRTVAVAGSRPKDATAVALRRRPSKVTRAHGYPFPYARYRWGGPTTDLPARTWGKVFFSTRTGDYVCSGTAVSSANESVVWTAGHCAADGAGRTFYNHRWVFVPGYDNGKAPFGRFVGRRFFTTQAWFRRGDSSFDLAAVVVAPLKGKTLVQTVGGQGIAFNQPRTQEYVSGGYPADYPFDGHSLYVCDAPLGSNDRATSPPTLAIGCDMTGGSSGGGWLADVQNGLGTLVSVNSYGYLDEPDAMYGPYQGGAAERLYQQASASR